MSMWTLLILLSLAHVLLNLDHVNVDFFESTGPSLAHINGGLVDSPELGSCGCELG